MRSKKRRLVGALVVVLAAVFAACFAREPDTSTIESELYFTPGSDNGLSSCGSATVGGSSECAAVTISPHAGEHWVLMNHPVSPCGTFVIEDAPNGTVFPYHIACLPMGASNGPAVPFPSAAGSQVGECIPSTYVVRARFQPTGSGAASCTVPVNLVNISAGGIMSPKTIQYSGTGHWPPVGLQLNPSTYNFGAIPTGTASSHVMVTVTNNGGQAASVTAMQSNPTNFKTSGLPSSQQLAAGGSTTFEAWCEPGTSAAPLNGTITLNATGAMGGTASRTLSLTCTGIVSNVTIAPNPVAFASTLVGGQARAITVSIGATVPMTLTNVVLEAGHSPDLSIPAFGNSVGIGSGSNYDVTVTYTPTQAQAQGPLGTLNVMTQGAQGPATRTVAITGEALLGKIAAAPGVIDFGPVCVGQTATQTFEVYAEAAGGFNLMDVVDPATPFAVTSTEFSAPHALRGNHANTVQFTSTVQPTVAGEHTAEATLKTNLPLNPDLPIELRALALPDGVSPTPNALNFGPNPVRTPTIARKIVVSNCGATPVTISAVRITGTNATEFAIVSSQDPLVEVPQDGQLELLVVMSPQTNGVKIAQIEIDHQGGMAIAALEGTAFGGETGTETEMGTYYSCSVGAGAGLMPLGVAFLVLRRRRRHRA